MTPSLLILAAGIGSRYGGLKQMDTFGPAGETIIEYSIYDAIRAGFRKIVMVIRRDMQDQFEQFIDEKYRGNIEVHFVYQELDNVPDGIRISQERKKPWGTAHAVIAAAGEIKESFAVINADDFYGLHSFQLCFDYLSSADKNDSRDYCIIGFRLSKTLSEHGHVARAICETDTDGYLINLIERTHIVKTGRDIVYQDKEGKQVVLTGNTSVSMNMMGFTPSVFHHLDSAFRRFIALHAADQKAELYLPNVVGEIVKANKARVKVLKTNETWFGVTYKEDKASVKSKMQELVHRGYYPSPLLNE
jgi:bifunctional N-acetylglucosamine-1-phosphate-uridyltransferase/glucosamine-1-phosphate-acetyltransferase GlmU-like protein